MLGKERIKAFLRGFCRKKHIGTMLVIYLEYFTLSQNISCER